MLNNDKVRVMTKLAIYEKKSGKEDIRLSQYYKRDYVRLQILNTIVYSTIGYLLMLLLVGIYESEYLIANAVTLNYKTIGIYVFGVYAMFLTISILCTVIGSTLKFQASRRKLAGYNKGLECLHQIYESEDK